MIPKPVLKVCPWIPLKVDFLYRVHSLPFDRSKPSKPKPNPLLTLHGQENGSPAHQCPVHKARHIQQNKKHIAHAKGGKCSERQVQRAASAASGKSSERQVQRAASPASGKWRERHLWLYLVVFEFFKFFQVFLSFYLVFVFLSFFWQSFLD